MTEKTERTVKACASELYVGMPVYLDESDNIDCFPAAMTYTPWQKWQETYDPETGFNYGTIFPCLNLPFLGGNK